MLFSRKTPLCLPHTRAIGAVLSVAIILFYFFADRPVAEFFHQTPPSLTSLSYLVSDLIAPYPHLLFWPLAFFCIRFIFKNEKMGNRFLFILISVSVVNCAILPIKVLLGRYRPELLFSDHLYGFQFFATHHFDTSFPSAHAATISAILFSIACLYPKWFSSLFVATFCLAFARVVATKHYLSDITASLLLGLIISQYIYFLMKQSRLSFK